MVQWTQNISALAKSGVVLTNHYTHWHCSPTRRSFLTGRLPTSLTTVSPIVTNSTQQDGYRFFCGDSTPLAATMLSEKLASVGYVRARASLRDTLRHMRHIGSQGWRRGGLSLRRSATSSAKATWATR